jgi:hypothetical protein
MLPITLVETDREDFDGPIVEFWRGEEFIGMVFHDGEDSILQIYPDGDGDVHDLDVAELQTLLDTAIRIVDPGAMDEELALLQEAAGVGEESSWDSEEHPATTALLKEFDPKAIHRTEDGEGFFPRGVAQSFIGRCEELDLAVVEMEGFDFRNGELSSNPAMDLVVTPQSMMSWSEFRTYANTTAANALATWPSRDSIVIAFVFQQPDTELIVA